MTLATTAPFEIEVSLASSQVAGSVLCLGVTQDKKIPDPGATVCQNSRKAYCLRDSASSGVLVSSFILSLLSLGSRESVGVRS